jgi:hypothetical protein
MERMVTIDDIREYDPSCNRHASKSRIKCPNAILEYIGDKYKR